MIKNNLLTIILFQIFVSIINDSKRIMWIEEFEAIIYIDTTTTTSDNNDNNNNNNENHWANNYSFK